MEEVVTTRLTLRPYQQECVDAHFSFFGANPDGCPLFVVPTGAGKSLIIAEFIERLIRQWPAVRVLILTHVKELIQQNHDEFCNHWPDAPSVGVHSAGLKRRDVDSQILFAGVQSIVNRIDEVGVFDLILIDECHLVPKRGLGRYLTFIEAMRNLNHNLRVCGYTATHYRMDGGYLHVGEDRIFTDVAYEVKLNGLIEDGYLARLVARMPENEIDTTGVRTVAGEFNSKDLEAAATEGDMVALAMREVILAADKYDRHHMLFFAIGVRHAEMIAECLQMHGVDVECVFGHTDKVKRAEVIQRFKAGNLEALVNVGVLTTGFNAPCCDLMAVLRPTKSTSLYVQIMGRGMRMFPGKEKCLVLDFGGNVMRHGPINMVRPRGEGRGDGDGTPPQKVCPECAAIIMAGVTTCPECGAQFARESEHDTKSSAAEIIFDTSKFAARTESVWLDVDDVFFRRHKKAGKPDSMRVDYRCGMRMISEWICFEHAGYAQRKAYRWWNESRRRKASMIFPLTVAEALGRVTELKMAIAVLVGNDKGHDRVVRVTRVEEEDVAERPRR